MPNKIVARFIDGRIARGSTTDFMPNRDIFHIVSKEEGKNKSTAIKMAELKAVFFVKELEGLDKDRPVIKRDFDDVGDKKLIGKKVKVTFLDGEELLGLTLGYSPQRRGFFFTPIDPESNNERVFAVLTAVKDIEFYE
ncbi:hypothetical protein JXB22_00645 [candidate division WOR-3 bacterium]|nr:hypothetical protein [candidate division WOR-3 bacterium]